MEAGCFSVILECVLALVATVATSALQTTTIAFYLKLKPVMEGHNPVSLFRLLLIQSFMVWLAMSSSNTTDQSALLAFKFGIKFDPTNVLAHNWTTSTSFCNWIGVTCSTRRQRVTVLDLGHMGLQGTISPHLSNLSFLVVLELQNNSFHGSLAHEFGHLHRLKGLWLQYNYLEGTIPRSLHQCRRLQVIYLADNNFTGGIPAELGMLPELRYLSFGENYNLLGTIPLSLGNITKLEYLAVERSGLTGSIPFAIFNLSSLWYIFLPQNTISGTLPDDLCLNCPNLEELVLAYNQISGPLPSMLPLCQELTQLVLFNNSLNGSIVEGIGNLPKLEKFYIGNNKIAGTIPPSLGNISSLVQLYLGDGHIHGNIPNDLGRLSKLIEFNIEVNYLTGAIPQEIFSISFLQYICLDFNDLSGKLPETAGLQLPNLMLLQLQNNQLGGNIPAYLSNSSRLTRLNLEANLFTGPMLTNFGNLQLLQEINVGDNQLTRDPGSPELHFLTSLTNCRRLENLVVEYNQFNGILPNSIGNRTSPLLVFVASNCQIMGHIPRGIGYFENLNTLFLDNNGLTGTIPSTIGKLQSLQRLYLDGNKMEGIIPKELCLLKKLGELSLQNNGLSGPIPPCIANISLLQKVLLGSNALNSSIPANFWSLENLIVLNLSSNDFRGSLPLNIGKLEVIENMDLSWNKISGNILPFIGAFQRLSSLNLSRNSFEGTIPQSFGDLIALESIDLSCNNLSGSIPKSLEKLRYLSYLNLSFNKFSGEIPSGGPFANFTAKSFLHNEALCGSPYLQVSPCNHGTKKSNMKKIVLTCVVAATVLVAVIGFLYMLRKYQQSKVQTPDSVELLSTVEHRLISYQELCVATSNFSEANLVGVGSFGSVYRGMLSDGTDVAVKILNLQVDGAFRSFAAECQVLRTVRHRNLVKVISSCSNPEVRALVLKYMPNGSLEKWLYSHNYCLNFFQRVSIMLDVALALEYLHHGQSEPIAHCDLKPSNVLLDEDMVAHLGDFGISKILVENRIATQTQTLGTLGYVAPEYGLEGRVSMKCDIYSYGIMLLEIFTRKRPTDEMFAGELSLKQLVKGSLPNSLAEAVDGNLLRLIEGSENMIAYLLLILEVGLECCAELPEERINIKDVVTKLNKIKLQLLRDGHT
ncbi:unnamed protein product [Camellia sinensis]